MNKLNSFLIFTFLFYAFVAFGQQADVSNKTVTFGIISDVHSETGRLQVFVDKAIKEKPDFIIQLGDLSHGKKEDTEAMIAVWNKYPGRNYHVLGNHDMDYATKNEIIKRQDMSGAFYSFDYGDFHFVVLDCNYILKDGKYIDYANANYYIDYPNRDLINPEQIEWMEQDINTTDKKVIIFSHESLDDLTMRGTNPVPNRLEVRNVIDKINKNSSDGKKIIACFAGHDHVDHYNLIDGVHYFAINSAYGFKKSLELKESIYAFITLNNIDKTITIEGTTTDFKKKPEKEDYEPYPIELIHPYISDRKVNY